MKISFIKDKNDQKNYKIPQAFGMDIYEIENPEEIDKKIEELKEKKYTTIFIPNELASFSEDIIKRYVYNPEFKIIITPSKN